MTCTGCDNMRRELERIREVATVDLQNAHNDLVAKNRELGRLKAELTNLRDSEPDNDDVRNVLLHWKAQTHKNGRTYIGSDGKRYKLAKTAVKRWGVDRCMTAVNGIAAYPFAGPRGRTATQEPGSKRFDDIEHCLGDEVRFERAEALSEHTPEERRTLGFVAKDAQAREVKEARKVRKSLPPIQTVLGRLNELGLSWKPGHHDSWAAQCPAHDDSDPSLSIRETDRGDVLLHCFGGCETDAVIAALGIGYFDLFAVGVAA